MAVQKVDPKVIFASNAPTIDKPPVFGDKTKGWDVARANEGRPEIKEMNKLQQDTDLKILWLNENSVTPYDLSIDYPEGAVTIKDGSFKQLVDGAWVEFLDDFANKDDVKRGTANRYDSTFTYNSGDRVALTNGDIVKSTINGNTNDPNTDMTGWLNIGNIGEVESIADLIAIPNPLNGSHVSVKSYHMGLNRGGRGVVYDESRASENDGIFVFNGWVSEPILSLSPDHAGAKPNDATFDNTSMLNQVLATGLDLYGNLNDVYHVSGKIYGKGQILIGGFKINSSRKVRPEHISSIGEVETSQNVITNKDSIKMIFVQKSVDLIEFYKIKSLGINTILHYGELSNGDTYDQFLDNALTAGLRVIVGTENYSGNIPEIASWISSIDSHPAVYAYSMFDEPVGRGISIQVQQEKLNAIRAVTKKQLTVTEYYVSNMYSEFLIKDYDIVFCHNYAYNYTTGTLQEWIEKDCSTARRYFGFYSRFMEGKTIIPVCGLFKSDGSDGFSLNTEQILNFATIYASNTDDNIGFFLWDGLVENVANNEQFQTLLSSLVKKVSKSNQTKAILFGQIDGGSIDFGTSDLVDLPLQHSFDSSELPKNTDAYVGRLHTSGSNSLFGTTAANAVYAGICFKTTSAIFYSSFTVGKFCTVKLDLFDTEVAFSGNIKFYLSNDLGVTKTLCGTASSNYIELSFKNPFSADAILIIEITSTEASNYFRRFLRGAIISTNW